MNEYQQDISGSNGAARYPAAAAAPLKHHGKLVGVLVIAGAVPDQFSENDLRLLRSIGEQAALAVRNAQLYAELQSYAQNLEDMVEVRTEELRATQAQLVRTEKLAALGRLAAGIAHEVNNPLQPILNCLEVTLEDIENGDQVDSEVLRVAEREVQRIKTIVTRLLDFARPNTTDKVDVDLRDLIDEVLVLTAKQLERMRVRVHKDLGRVPPLNGNPTQLKQVMLNLVLNAMEAMPEGGDLTIELRCPNGEAVITIMDTGVGMDSQTVARIFEPFYSTKDEGTGLGLAVTYGIIEGHGGSIQVDSEPGKGSRFTIWLPYATAKRDS
jgi:two-component system NtrC family sensor kinase